MATFQVTRAEALEANVIEFVVSLVGPPAPDAVTVEYRTVSGSALSGTDVVFPLSGGLRGDPLTGLIEFAVGETTKTLRFVHSNDSDDELDESYFLELFNARNADFGGANQSLRVTGWVLDDDGPGSNHAVSVSSPTVVEAGGGEAEFTISLSQAFAVDTMLDFSTFDGSAVAGEDYVAQAGEVLFRANQTEATVAVRLRNDRDAEAAETFGLAVSGGGVAGAAGAATILDTDARPRQPIVSVEGARAPEGNVVTFTIRLSERATDAVTVEYRTVSGSALSGTDVVFPLSGGLRGDPLTGLIEFAVGETTKTLRFVHSNDSDDELDESYFLELFDPVNADFGGANQSLRATGWVLDDDGPFNNRAVSVSSPRVVERAGAGPAVAVFEVELSQAATQRLVLDFETVAGSAAARQDFRPQTGEVVFEAGQTRASVAIALRADTRVEGAETFSLRIEPPFPTAISGSLGAVSGTATILDGSFIGTDRNDRIRGTAGADAMVGGDGNDRYVVNSPGDRVVEERRGGVDTLLASVDVTLAGNVENARLLGRRNLDATGNALDNDLRGNGGRNRLDGGNGDDRLGGGAGADVLIGGRGADQLAGGGDADRFVFRAERDSTPRARDAIRDFERRVDEIDLSGFDANARRAGEQGFDFIGRDRFGDVAGELRFSAGRLQGDTDGDGRADFVVALRDIARLAEADLIL